MEPKGVDVLMKVRTNNQPHGAVHYSLLGNMEELFIFLENTSIIDADNSLFPTY